MHQRHLLYAHQHIRLSLAHAELSKKATSGGTQESTDLAYRTSYFCDRLITDVAKVKIFGISAIEGEDLLMPCSETNISCDPNYLSGGKYGDDINSANQALLRVRPDHLWTARDNISYENGTMLISDIRIHDENTYFLQILNHRENFLAPCAGRVAVSQRMPESKSATEGAEVSLPCFTNPILTALWFKNGYPIVKRVVYDQDPGSVFLSFQIFERNCGYQRLMIITVQLSSIICRQMMPEFIAARLRQLLVIQ